MQGESAHDAAMRVAQSVLDEALEPGSTPSPPHDLLPNTCVKVAGEWVVFRRLDDRGHLVVGRPGTVIEWTYEPTDGELILSAEPF